MDISNTLSYLRQLHQLYSSQVTPWREDPVYKSNPGAYKELSVLDMPGMAEKFLKIMGKSLDTASLGEVQSFISLFN